MNVNVNLDPLGHRCAAVGSIPVDGYGYGYILGPSPVPPIYLAGSFGLVRPAWI